MNYKQAKNVGQDNIKATSLYVVKEPVEGLSLHC